MVFFDSPCSGNLIHTAHCSVLLTAVFWSKPYMRVHRSSMWKKVSKQFRFQFRFRSRAARNVACVFWRVDGGCSSSRCCGARRQLSSSGRRRRRVGSPPSLPSSWRRGRVRTRRSWWRRRRRRWCRLACTAPWPGVSSPASRGSADANAGGPATSRSWRPVDPAPPSCAPSPSTCWCRSALVCRPVLSRLFLLYRLRLSHIARAHALDEICHPSLHLRFNGHFPGEPGLVGFIEAEDDIA